MMFDLRITLFLLLAAGTMTVKGQSTTVPTRGDGLEASAVPDQGSTTTVSTTGESSTTVSTTGGSSTTESTTAGLSTTAFTTTAGLSSTASITTGGVTPTNCPPLGDLWLLLKALLGRWSSNGRRPTGGHGGGRWSNNGRGGPRGGFQGSSRPRNPRALPSTLLNNLNQGGRLSSLLNNLNQEGRLSNFLNNFDQSGRLSSLLNNLSQGGRLSSLLNNLNQGGQLSSLLNSLNQEFLGSLRPRSRRGLRIYDLIRGSGGTSRPTPTQPTGQKNSQFDLADALHPGPDNGPFNFADAVASAEKLSKGDFQEKVIQKLDTIDVEVKQLFHLLPQIMAQSSSK